MAYQSKPTSDGVYYIRVLNQNLCIESVPGPNPGMRLAAPSASNNKQKWNLRNVAGQSNVWTIVSVEDLSGVVYKQMPGDPFWGYGFPYPEIGRPSINWYIADRTTDGQSYSKIRLTDNPNCFDSAKAGSDAVHFYYDHVHVYDGPKQCFVFELVPSAPVPPTPVFPEPVSPAPTLSLDVMFIQDATGSQQPYIDKARNDINQICQDLLFRGNFAPNDLRFGLVAFRDHPPQDTTMLTQTFPFTSDPGTFASNLSTLTATGGGDGPEAQADALDAAYNAPWNDEAIKVAVLITDSPPHGIKEDNDGFPQGTSIDPLVVAKRMARVGITLYVIACEPTLSQYYKYARDFYEGLAQKTGGKVLNLGDPTSLPNIIVGSALEAFDAEILVTQHQASIRSKADTRNISARDIAKQLHSELSGSGVEHHGPVVENIYEPSKQGVLNAQVWFEAETLQEATAKIKQVEGNRLIEKFTDEGEHPATVEKQPISLAQVEAVVQKCLVRA